MIILGIDPGIAILGYGVIKYEKDKLYMINYGALITKPSSTMPERLSILYRGLKDIINKYKPDDLAVEELFFNKNVKTALTVGHARGVSLLCAYEAGLNIFEYTPLQVKQSIVGYGRADKMQIQQMVKAILGLKTIPKPDDAADALAIAICHAHSSHVPDMFRIK
ncbi:MAG: crossover junction endodeoxyribonuclease RuvC [Clostridiales bacterium]|nr:crossover junction endodeoxyribonuclease RuvC [Clostridiales bacterium]HBM81273.1 crossover junction endodeoxyribonuclease RuvC [Clostridiaceae bacterium]